MKLLVIVLVFSASIGSCRKEKNSSYQGRWELRSSITIEGLVEYPPRNGHLIIFSGDKMTFISSGTAKIEEKYNIRREPNSFVEPARLMDRIITPVSDFFVELSGNKLAVYPPFSSSDAGGSIYERIW